MCLYRRLKLSLCMLFFHLRNKISKIMRGLNLTCFLFPRLKVNNFSSAFCVGIELTALARIVIYPTVNSTRCFIAFYECSYTNVNFHLCITRITETVIIGIVMLAKVGYLSARAFFPVINIVVHPISECMLRNFTCEKCKCCFHLIFSKDFITG